MHFLRITVRFTEKKPIMLAAKTNEDTRLLFYGHLTCFSVALFSDAFNRTQKFLRD